MSAPASTAWTCPQCQRRVPGRVSQCHCGLERREPFASVPAPAARPVFDPRRTRAVLLAVAVLAVALTTAWLALPPRAAPERDAGRPSQGAAGGRYPPLPVLPLASPARTAARQRHAGTLGLDARLGRIGEGTRRLESDYRALVARCASEAGGPGSGADEWLLTLLAARMRGPVDSGGAVPASCDSGWNDLVTRTGALKADLDGAERLARAAGLPSRDWQAALAAHGLERWYEY